MAFDMRQAPRIQRKEEPQPTFSNASNIERYFQKPSLDALAQQEQKEEEPETYSEPENENIGQILHQWQAPEFEVYEKSSRWYLIAFLFIVGMIGYALFINAPLMAITFILVGIVGYIYTQKDPRVITFSITSKGVVADKELYAFDNIHSFWIFYEPPHTKTISLHTKASMLPHVHIPLEDEDPGFLHEILSKYIPEIKQEARFMDTLEKVLHI